MPLLLLHVRPLVAHLAAESALAAEEAGFLRLAQARTRLVPLPVPVLVPFPVRGCALGVVVEEPAAPLLARGVHMLVAPRRMRTGAGCRCALAARVVERHRAAGGLHCRLGEGVGCRAARATRLVERHHAAGGLLCRLGEGVGCRAARAARVVERHHAAGGLHCRLGADVGCRAAHAQLQGTIAPLLHVHGRVQVAAGRLRALHQLHYGGGQAVAEGGGRRRDERDDRPALPAPDRHLQDDAIARDRRHPKFVRLVQGRRGHQEGGPRRHQQHQLLALAREEVEAGRRGGVLHEGDEELVHVHVAGASAFRSAGKVVLLQRVLPASVVRDVVRTSLDTSAWQAAAFAAACWNRATARS